MDTVTLQYGLEQVVLSTEEVAGRTLAQLYSDYSDELGYEGGGTIRTIGRLQSVNSVPEPGVYTATITHDEKGRRRR
jgi:hypothetical protein